MKSTKIAARRVIQAGATFAALGALSIATALPAAADEQYGWAYATSNGGNGFIETQEGSVSDAFSVDYGWVSWSGTSTASVTGSGVLATVEVPSVRVQITVKDAEAGLPTEDEEIEEIEEDETEDEEPTEEPSDDASEGGEDNGGDDTSGGGEDNGSEGGTGGDTDETAPTTPPVDEDDETVTPSPEPSPSPSADDTDADALVVVPLNEDNSETVADSDEILVEATISGISVSTFKSWDGSVQHNVNPGTVSDITAPEDVEFTITPDIYEWEQPTEIDGYTWEDAYSILDYDFKANGELVQYVTIAETGVGIITFNEGENPGEEKPRPEKPIEKPAEQDKKPVAKPAEALATTGSPIGGLIAAGAAIAAGGGAAAYLARRKKTAVEAPAEENDN